MKKCVFFVMFVTSIILLVGCNSNVEKNPESAIETSEHTTKVTFTPEPTSTNISSTATPTEDNNPLAGFNITPRTGMENKKTIEPKSIPDYFLFETDGISLEYPYMWWDIHQNDAEFCQSEEIECFLRINSPEYEVTMDFVRFPLVDDISLEEIDQQIWNNFFTNYQDVDLASRENISIGNTSGIYRQFSAVTADNEEPIYLKYLIFFDEDLLYQILVTGSEAGEQYNEQIYDIIHSIELK